MPGDETSGTICDADWMDGLVGNKAIEDVAVKWVIGLECAAGRQPKDTRHTEAAADIESPPRVIEIKAFGTSARGDDLWLETRQVDEGHKNPNFYVYVVENVRQGDPMLFTLRVLGGTRLQHLLTHAREQHYFTVPWPVANYDDCPTGLID